MADYCSPNDRISLRDRSLQATIGPGVFGARTGNGVMLGGERVGGFPLGLQQGQGLNLGSFLNLGNQPINR
uniref:Uncharacterized protein n=1 Tax=Ditylenchus dipsaci TaxID=166011 RepID=A0A915DX92_9BILA